MTVAQIKKAIRSNRYIVIRDWDGRPIGVNCQQTKLLKDLDKHHGNKETRFQSFHPCGLMEYITHKIPFM